MDEGPEPVYDLEYYKSKRRVPPPKPLVIEVDAKAIARIVAAHIPRNELDGVPGMDALRERHIDRVAMWRHIAIAGA